MYYEFVVLGWVFTMCNFKLSSGLNNMLQAMLKDSEFKKIQYYMRCLKKAPHGGVFRNTHQSAFLKYYRVQTFPFLEKDRPVPYPIELYKVNVTQMLDCYDVDMEELLGFCFGTKTNVGDVSFEEAYGGNQFFSALASGALSLKDPIAYSFVDVLADAVEGRIKFTDYFDYDYSRLTEELHTLHPLVLNSRWLFGAQYDSPMFVSNSALTTVVKSLFKDTDYDLDVIENPRRRPDIICLKQYSLKAVCTDRIDTAAGEIMKPDQILIVEVKRGGFEITSEEVAQVEHYVRQIRKSAILHSSATIDAYVVGAKLGDIDTEKKTNSGRIHAVTYGHLVVTASQKLFNLRQRLQEHYATLGQESIVEQALKETKQLKMYN